jgi:microcystin-dependent protein
MSTPFLGEIRMFAFNFPPKSWAQCDGQLLPISQNTALFSLLGTFYGGNGTTTFQLPDLRSRVAMSFDNAGNHPLGELGGAENHSLLVTEMPAHNHTVRCSSAGDNSGTPTSPVGNFWTRDLNGNAPYANSGASGAMHPSAVGLAGGSQPHSNLQPLLVVNFCIALGGIFPSRN